MKITAITAFVLLSFLATARGQQNLKPQEESFQLTAVAPPTPAMKYQLLYQKAYEKNPGNAATLYMDALLMVAPEELDLADKALDKYDAGDKAGFNSLAADKLDRPGLMRELELAGHREYCDWGAPAREEGVYALLPHLNNLRGIAMFVKVQALRQMEQGKIDDAINTFCIGYELSDNVSRERYLVSGLVSLGITKLMDDGLQQLMNRPDAPNLYWALSRFPSRKPIFTREIDGDSIWWVALPVNLARLKDGQALSAGEWQSTFDYIAELAANKPQFPAHEPSHTNPVGAAGPGVLSQARERYAQAHQVSPDAASQVDPIIVLGEYQFHQYDIACDEMSKLLGLPYPTLLAKTKEFDDYAIKLKEQNPRNPFLKMLPTIHRGAWTFARTDRELAAMTAVEAIRSYAAANGGNLPSKLEDVTATPVPDNPATGMPFDYGVNGDTATISDSQSEQTLSYAISIRK